MKWLFFAFALSSVACGPGARGAVSPDGFVHHEYDLKVAPAAEGRLMPEGWELENFVVRGTRHQAKTSPRYLTSFSLDKDADGVFETTIEAPLFDLHFEHLAHDGKIFLRSFPISTRDHTKHLDVLLARYLESLTVAGYDVVEPNPRNKMVVETRRTARLLRSATTKLAGLDALVAEIEVADPDQLRLDPNARTKVIQAVFAHTPFVEKAGFSAEFPVLLFAVYHNHPSRFGASVRDFHDLLGRISVEGKRGFVAPALLAPAPNASGTEAPTISAFPEVALEELPRPAADPDPSTPSPDSSKPSEDPPAAPASPVVEPPSPAAESPTSAPNPSGRVRPDL